MTDDLRRELDELRKQRHDVFQRLERPHRGRPLGGIHSRLQGKRTRDGDAGEREHHGAAMDSVEDSRRGRDEQRHDVDDSAEGVSGVKRRLTSVVRPGLSSVVVAPTSAPRERPVDRDEPEEVRSRNQRVLGRLFGTLQQFKKEIETVEPTLHTRQEMEERLTQREREEAERLREERQAERQRLRENAMRLSREIRLKEIELEERTVAELLQQQYERTAQCLKTSAQPPVLYVPAKHTDATQARIDEQVAAVAARLEAARQRLAERKRLALESLEAHAAADAAAAEKEAAAAQTGAAETEGAAAAPDDTGAEATGAAAADESAAGAGAADEARGAGDDRAAAAAAASRGGDDEDEEEAARSPRHA